MNRSVTSSIVVLSFLIMSTFAAFIGASLVNNRQIAQTTQTQAQSGSVCSMSINAYVHEIDSNGNEVPLDFENNSDLIRDRWGLRDELIVGQTQIEPLYFNIGSRAQYKAFTTQLSFSEFPNESQIYSRGARTSVRLLHENDIFEIARKEIKTCNKDGINTWLCTENEITSDTTSNIDTIDNIYVDCDMNLEFGWVVKRVKPLSLDNIASDENSFNAFFAGLDPRIQERLDINQDNAYNTLDLLVVIVSYGFKGNDVPADVNLDGSVNALDYTLVLEAIENR